jgi:hypothetical protein
VVQLKHEMTRQADLHAVQCKAWSEQHEVITPYYDSVFNGLTFMGGCAPFAVQEALVQLRAAEGKIAALESDAHRNAASFEADRFIGSVWFQATIVSLRARAYAAEEAQTVTAKTIVSLEAKLKVGGLQVFSWKSSRPCCRLPGG